MWFKELDGAEHPVSADVSRNTSNIVLVPANKRVSKYET